MSRWRPEERWLRLAVGTGGEASAPRWQAALAQFEAWLEDAPPRGRRSVLIPSEFVRYLVVPWQPQLQRADDHAAFVNHCFEQIHGAAATAWSCRAADPLYGKPALACAVDSAMLAQLSEAATARGRRMAHLQPALVQAWNASRAELPAGRLWFALVEDGWATLMRVDDGSPCHLRSQRCTASALPHWLERETRASGLEGTDAPLYVAGAPAGFAPIGATFLPYAAPEAARAAARQPD